MKRPMIRFDPRSKLALLFFASFLLMFRCPWQLELLFIILLEILLLLCGAGGKAVFFVLLLLALLLGEHGLTAVADSPVAGFITFLVVGNRRMLPSIMAASLAVSGTKISEWLAALQKWRLPFYLIVPLTVLFRFFPTLLQDFKSIRNAMKFRGIALSSAELLLHPFQTVEYIIIPLLMSAENTSLDLSAAALVRGITIPGRHTSVYDPCLGLPDYLLLAALAGLAVGRSWLL